MNKIKLEIGQTWISETHPHESFKIYDGIGDGNEVDFYVHDIPFENIPEKARIYFWERVDKEAFNEFVKKKKGLYTDSSYPYAWAGECKRAYLVNKIRRYDMKLKED